MFTLKLMLIPLAFLTTRIYDIFQLLTKHLIEARSDAVKSNIA